MWIRRGLAELQLETPTCLTIGAFDGVHLGHQALFRALVTAGRDHGLQSVVLTFDPLPRQVLSGGGPGLLSSLEERLDVLQMLGLDGVLVYPFTAETARTSAAEFIADLVARIPLHCMWLGPDFRLGRDREGDVAALRALGAEYGFEVHVLEQVVRWQGVPVRSSRIRRALREGNLEEVNGCLGRPFRLTGTVGHGDKRGRLMGFPTANLRLPSERLLPAHGVYVCSAHLRNGSYAAITNVGIRPTFDHHTPLVEAHLLDFSGELYDAPIQLDFHHRLRPELRFATVDALVAQMREDEAEARAWLRAQGLSFGS